MPLFPVPVRPAHVDRWSLLLLLQIAGCIPVALVELFRARLMLARLGVADIDRCNQRSASMGRNPEAASPGDADKVALVGHVIPRVARFVPWRSDCLVQAMAAQRWLLRRGIASMIVIGIDRTREEGFLSHAWLSYGNQGVTGGVVDRYTVIIEGSPGGPSSG